MGRISVEELLNRYGAGERNFAETVLTGAEMTNVDLSGIDLSNSDLGEIYMEDVNFTGANLRTSRIGQSSIDDLVGWALPTYSTLYEARNKEP
jgi:uncharacterized protein YjbI with pentapeptide repeats